MKRALLAFGIVLLAGVSVADSPIPIQPSAVLQTGVAAPLAPGTGLFAPGKFYSVLGVVTAQRGFGPDWSACVSTTLGALQLTPTSYFSFDALGGFSFSRSVADAGFDIAFNFGGVSLGKLLRAPNLNSITIGGEIGPVALTSQGRRAGYGAVAGIRIQF